MNWRHCDRCDHILAHINPTILQPFLLVPIQILKCLHLSTNYYSIVLVNLEILGIVRLYYQSLVDIPTQKQGHLVQPIS